MYSGFWAPFYGIKFRKQAFIKIFLYNLQYIHYTLTHSKKVHNVAIFHIKWTRNTIPPLLQDSLYLLDLFVQNDQATAAVSFAEIPRQRGGADVSLIFRVYFRRGTSGSEYTVKRLVAIFQRRKSEILLKNIIKK